MTIYRVYTQRDLQLDVNLLTSVFPGVLADALDRVLDTRIEEMPSVAQVPEFVPAQAS
jgi:hypothetical protein